VAIPTKRLKMRGKFITFEGGEGTGKSTQAGMLANKLESLGLGVLVTREPGGSPGAEIIRHVLLSGAAKPLGADAEAMLFAAAREDHVRCTIEPALAAGKWVVCDRFADSTRVYQGALGQVDRRLIKGLERVSIGDLLPDLTLVLDVPVEFHEKLREAFRALAAGEPERCVIIDASVPRVQVAKDIWDTVQAKLEPATVPLSLEEPAPETLVS
jgi:dTMP kinase